MGHELGPLQREVLQRIGKHIEMFGDARMGDIAKEMALARGLVAMVVDVGAEVAHAIGLCHALTMLERSGLVTRCVGGTVKLTRIGAAVVGEKEGTAADCHALG
jgi:hypothetical protein